MGAWPLRRAIQRVIEDPLADFVLGAELTPGATIVVTRKEGDENGEVDISIVAGPPPEPELEKVTVPPEGPEALPEPDERAE